jgi:hypothetical protein
MENDNELYSGNIGKLQQAMQSSAKWALLAPRFPGIGVL